MPVYSKRNQQLTLSFSIDEWQLTDIHVEVSCIKFKNELKWTFPSTSVRYIQANLDQQWIEYRWFCFSATITHDTCIGSWKERRTFVFSRRVKLQSTSSFPSHPFGSYYPTSPTYSHYISPKGFVFFGQNTWGTNNVLI